MTSRPLALVALALLVGSCGGTARWPWGTTQRLPGPMESLANPLPPGDAKLYPPGPEEVLVIRHADPVQVRPAGLTSSYPLSFYNKSQRVFSGSTVYAAPGGRIEVLWPNGNSVVIFGRGAGIVGSPSRGEPGFLFRQVERAFIDMREEDQIELIGGAQLSASSGPFAIDHVRPDILRVKNQSKEAGQLAFREAVFTLDPGQVIDLPLLSAGGQPNTGDATFSTTRGPGFDVRHAGEPERLSRPGAIGLRAVGEHEVHGLGVRVRIERDEEVWFETLGTPAAPRAQAPAQSEPAPTGEAPAPAPPVVPEGVPTGVPTDAPATDPAASSGADTPEKRP